MRPLTKKQQQAFNFIKKSLERNGYFPTYREIGKTFGITAHAARDRVLGLIRKGYIEKAHNKARAFKIIER